MTATPTEAASPTYNIGTAQFGLNRGRKVLAAGLLAGLVGVGAWIVLSLHREAPAPIVAPTPEPELAPLAAKTPVAPKSSGPKRKAKAARAGARAPVAAPAVFVAEPFPTLSAPPLIASAAEAVTPVQIAVAPVVVAPAQVAVVPVQVAVAPIAAEPAAVTVSAPVAVEAAQIAAAPEAVETIHGDAEVGIGGDGNGEAIARAIAAEKRSAVQTCFERELKQTPTLRGNVTVELDLAPPQQVNGVRVTDDLDRPAFTECVSSTMQHLSFDPLNEEVSVHVPYVLSPRAK